MILNRVDFPQPFGLGGNPVTKPDVEGYVFEQAIVLKGLGQGIHGQYRPPACLYQSEAYLVT